MPVSVDIQAATKAALRHFYDASRIRRSPLLRVIASWQGQDEPVAVVRGLLRDGIAQLEPDASVPYGRPEWMAHEVLTQRYIHLKASEAVCAELGLGRSSYYRYHQQAIDALSAWIEAQVERLAQESPPTRADIDVGTPAGQVERLVQNSRVEPVDLVRLVEDVAALLEPLLLQQGCQLRIVCPGTPPTVMASSALLRQALVSLISAALRVGVRTEIHMVLERVGDHAVIGMSTGTDVAQLSTDATAQSLEIASGVPMARALFRAYGGDTALTSGNGVTEMVCRLPLAEAGHVLIMDDSQDGARLMMTYLSGSQYLVDWVQTEQELDTALVESEPDVIILDILMPEADGWSILQRLKARPETADIPVLICSVLAQPELALALGAHAVVQKPVDEQTLLLEIGTALSSRAS